MATVPKKVMRRTALGTLEPPVMAANTPKIIRKHIANHKGNIPKSPKASKGSL